MKVFALATEKIWHDELFKVLQTRPNEKWHRLIKKEELTFEQLTVLKIEKVFIPHWSYIIPESVWSKFECVVFHMTDLPFGRGGSPLQNLISRGFKETKISALQVDYGIDTGKIYLKAPLSLLGTAQEIFLRSSEVIKEMIVKIIEENPEPVEQTGEIVLFKRRKPQESDIANLESIKEIYDHIRMLDADGYPNAFLENEFFRIEFTRASLKSNKTIISDVRITKK